MIDSKKNSLNWAPPSGENPIEHHRPGRDSLGTSPPFHRPFAIFLLPFLAGIVLGCRLPAFELPAMVLALMAAAVTIWWVLRGLSAFFAPLLLSFAIGYLSILPWMGPHLPDHHIANHLDDAKKVIRGLIVSSPLQWQQQQRFLLQVQSMGDGAGQQVPACGRLKVTAAGIDHALALGDRLTFHATPRSLKNFGNPGGFDYVRFMQQKGVRASAYFRTRHLIEHQRVAPKNMRPFLTAYRAQLAELIESNAHRDAIGVLQALTIGEKTHLSPAIRETFNRLGAGHLLAISGLHIGMLAAAFFLIFRWLLAPIGLLQRRGWVRKAAALLTILPVFGYGWMAGFSPSTQRAVAMVVVFLLALVTDRQADGINSLAIAAWVILLLDPPALMTVSFQLSFAAVLSIMILLKCRRLELFSGYSKPLTIDLRARLLSWLSAGFWVTAAATFGTLPLVLFYFHRLAWAGLGVNIILVPLVGYLVIPPALLAAAILPISPLFAAGLIQMASSLWLYLLEGMRALSAQSWVAMENVPFSLVELIMAYGVLAGLALVWAGGFASGAGWRRKAGGAVIGLAVLAAVGNGLWWYHDRLGRSQLRVTSVDVGAGMSTLVEFPYGPVMLVDGGGFTDNSRFDVGARLLAPLLLHRKIRSIDIVVLSHPNSDHLNGLLYLLDRFAVGQVLTNGQRTESMACQKLDALIAQRNLSAPPFRTLQRQFTINGVRVAILHPSADFLMTASRKGRDSANRNSMVVRLRYGDTGFLIPGDITAKGERALVSRLGKDLASTVLIVPHHGSLTSSSSDFVANVAPRYAVVSAGRYRRRHRPHRLVRGRYEAIGARLMPTYRHGAITFLTDGRQIEVDYFHK